MNLDWLEAHTIYLTKHGSQAYGLATPTSDLDVKGICVVPDRVELDLFHRFEQAENAPWVAEQCKSLVNPLNPKLESTVYGLGKFIKLAGEVNPNVIELLYTDPEDWVYSDNYVFARLFSERESFLSSKAKYTFTGYACAQIAKIERHRKWLLNPQEKPPSRSDFDLPEAQPSHILPVLSALKSQVDEWVLGVDGIDPKDRQELQQRCFDAINSVVTHKVTWDNWPSEYQGAALTELANRLDLGRDVVALINAELRYMKALRDHESYLQWKRNRNPERAVLEAKHGWDTKHGAHLVRLLHMGLEVLEGKGVIVKRPDAQFLMEIRRGEHSYDTIMDYAKRRQEEIEEAYKTTRLPRSVDKVKLNNLYLELREMMPSDPDGPIPA